MAMNNRKGIYGRCQQRRHERQKAMRAKNEERKGTLARLDLLELRAGLMELAEFERRQHDRWPSLARTRNAEKARRRSTS